MTRQQQKDHFSLSAHRLAVTRLRDEPARLAEALGVIARWRRQAGGAAHCDPYWSEWELMLAGGADSVERAVCVDTDRAATLRSMSPLGRFVTVAERNRLWREARNIR